MEIGLLQLLNTRCDANDEHNIVRMVDYFLYARHLCLVFEKLDMNLFELLKRNAFRGLSLNLVQLFLRQILQVGHRCRNPGFEGRGRWRPGRDASGEGDAREGSE